MLDMVQRLFPIFIHCKVLFNRTVMNAGANVLRERDKRWIPTNVKENPRSQKMYCIPQSCIIIISFHKHWDTTVVRPIHKYSVLVHFHHEFLDNHCTRCWDRAPATHSISRTFKASPSAMGYSFYLFLYYNSYIYDTNQ